MTMTICPKCNAENRHEAAFCANCGSILLASPNTAKSRRSTPVEPEPASIIKPELLAAGPMHSTPILPEPVIPEPTPVQTDEQPASPLEFAPLPEGSVFNQRFQYDTLVYQDGHENIYTVVEICEPFGPRVSACSNPLCRTIHVPTGSEPEKFCTRCGHPMDQLSPLLVLQEADSDQFSRQSQLIDLHLAHPNVHPPVAVFNQELSGGMRYYLVTPCSQELPAHPETSTVLEWGLQLAEGLDYLHEHGVVLGEELQCSCFGLVDEKIVWRNFNSARILPMLSDREKINNVRLLALSLYTWITGKAAYSQDSPLNPGINRLFQQALVGEGFTSGAKLANQILQTINAGLSPLNLDYHVGRRTHVGKVREINEDSLLCLTLSQVQQGVSQPVGILAVADGMGGHMKGELASSLTIQTILEKTTSELGALHKSSRDEIAGWLKQTIQAANQAVYDSRKKADSDMGSTLVCALLSGNRAYLTHLGDSRVYLLREKSIQQLSTDHSLVQQMISNGEISQDEARNHPQRNVILRCLGEKPAVDVEIFTQDLLPGDRLLLCSDGLSGMLDDMKIQIICNESASPQMACDYLIDSANLAGGTDNISVIVVEVILA
jgi:serine/threonine protein phosphatase PrpC